MGRIICLVIGHNWNRWSETLSNDPRGNYRLCYRCKKWEFKNNEIEVQAGGK